MQAYNQQHHVSYCAALAQHYEVAADDYLGLFVNCNAATVRYALTNTLEEAQAMFEGHIASTYTHVNDAAYPVLVYMNANEFVAWYDWENMCGYTTTAAHAVAA